MTNEELIQTAAARLNWKKTGDFLFADVACALETEQGNVYTGVVLGTYIPLCAEQSAVAAMVTAGEYKIKKIVAVWRSEQGELKILPPCGRCREFIKQVDNKNLQSEVILKDKVVKLEELLPYNNWFE